MGNRARVNDSVSRAEPPIAARLHDPSGPWIGRAVLPAIAVLATAVNTYWWWADGGDAPLGAFFGLALWMIATLLRGRNKPQRVALVAEANAVRVTRAGVLGQTIHARDIRAASTARTASGTCLALVRGDRTAPLLLELESDAHARALCDALGVGHAGFGQITWDREPESQVRALIRVTLAMGWLAVAAAFSFDNDLGYSMLQGVVGLSTIALLLLTLDERRLTMTLSPAGVIAAYGMDRTLHPYGQIREARAHTGGIDLVLDSGMVRPLLVTFASHSSRGLTMAEARLVADQITSAAWRAHGHGPPRDDVAGRVDVLRPRDESESAWLGRLDALAVMLAEGGGGYRRTDVAREDLWSALRDPDAPVDVRAGAARLLVRVDADAAPKVRAVTAKVRVAADADRILAALEPDIEEAAAKLRKASPR